MGFRTAYPKASRLSEIVSRPCFPEENFFVLNYACQQTEIFHRKLAVFVPIQTSRVVVAPRDGICPSGRLPGVA